MHEADPVYKRLAEHLDRQPTGFPPTPHGVELRILRRLFSPAEAELAGLLTLSPETPQAFAERTGRNFPDVADELESMASKGLIFRLRTPEDPEVPRYMAAQFLIGIWEYHVAALDPELIRDVNEYLPYFFREAGKVSTPQLRTIPVSRSLTPEQAVMPHDEAREIVLRQERIVVAPCICRSERALVGEGCGAPLESCLIFGAGAAYYEENGIGRSITPEEALRVIDTAEKKGLVLQPSNAQNPVCICACCSCCCQVLRNLRRLPDPSSCIASNYHAVVDAALCTGCGVCTARCPMDAAKQGEESAFIDEKRCIGCGLCVPTCPEGAAWLVSKERQVPPPPTLSDTYRRIGRERIKIRIAERKAGAKTSVP